jgi:hypothetical protein
MLYERERAYGLDMLYIYTKFEGAEGDERDSERKTKDMNK